MCLRDGDKLMARVSYEACPLCDCSDIPPYRFSDCSQHPLYRPPLPARMNWLRCQGCGHVFVDGYWTSEALGVLFGNTDRRQQVGGDFEQQRIFSAKIIEKVARHRSTGDWLDIGFGNGSLLFTAEEFGFRPVGADSDIAKVEALKKFGIESYAQDFETLPMAGRFDVISMADVLEHLPFPRRALLAAIKLLRPNGVLFVSAPNLSAPAWRMLDLVNANPYWSEIEHYHNFSRERLFALLSETGFTPTEYGVSERYRLGMEVVAVSQA
jgi:protein O-GlcNAc transferase